jgi:hypothetical protein
MFNADAMGTQTRTGFFDGATKVIKPLDLISLKSKSIVQQLWFSRAQRILEQLEHLSMLLDFFEFCY